MAELDGKVVLSCMVPVPADGRCEIKRSDDGYDMKHVDPLAPSPPRSALLELGRLQRKVHLEVARHPAAHTYMLCCGPYVAPYVQVAYHFLHDRFVVAMV